MFRVNHNPALGHLKSCSGQGQVAGGATYQGTALKTLYFVGLTTVTAIAVMVWLFNALEAYFDTGYTDNFPFGLLIGILIGGMVLSLVGIVGSIFARRAIPVFGTIYAVGQGAVIGVSSGFAELAVPGVVLAALLATFTVFVVMCILFFSGIVKVGQRFRSIMMSVLISVFVFSLLFMLMLFILPGLLGNFMDSPIFLVISIGISVIMIVVASLFILFDLSLIKEAVDGGLDKHFEWWGAFGLTVTLIWLYMEFLRLFLKIAALMGRRR